MSDWCCVEKRRSKHKVRNPIPIKLSKIKVIDGLQFLRRYDNIKEVYLYGSTARGENRPDSDIDIGIIWKNKLPDIEFIRELKETIVDMFGHKVDMINLVFKNKITESSNEVTQNFLNMIDHDLIPVFGDDKTFMRLSVFIGKF
jgi:predicted nucleotidyltransferase